MKQQHLETERHRVIHANSLLPQFVLRRQHAGEAQNLVPKRRRCLQRAKFGGTLEVSVHIRLDGCGIGSCLGGQRGGKDGPCYYAPCIVASGYTVPVQRCEHLALVAKSGDHDRGQLEARLEARVEALVETRVADVWGTYHASCDTEYRCPSAGHICPPPQADGQQKVMCPQGGYCDKMCHLVIRTCSATFLGKQMPLVTIDSRGIGNTVRK